MLTEVGPVEIDVPRDQDCSFEPKIVGKRQRRLSGVDDLVISLSAKGLATGEIAARLADVYGARRSNGDIGAGSTCGGTTPDIARRRRRPPQVGGRVVIGSLRGTEGSPSAAGGLCASWSGLADGEG